MTKLRINDGTWDAADHPEPQIPESDLCWTKLCAWWNLCHIVYDVVSG